MCVYVYVSVCNSLSPLLSIFCNTTDPPTISGPLLPLLSDILGRYALNLQRRMQNYIPLLDDRSNCVSFGRRHNPLFQQSRT